MYNGIINVYKEPGFTSHDIVAKLRGILKQKKIGHTGTLDPEAKGVLPVCLGKATKVCDMLTDKDKIYETKFLLGITTDTQDTTGEILTINENICRDENHIKEKILEFEGDYEQIPPMYSALKVNGRKLYELAREGKVVERKARKVKIKEIQIKNIEETNFEYAKDKFITTMLITMKVECSKGTYIRTLCHDIGEKLGCGACMRELTRTKVGSFEIEKALKLPEIEKLRDDKKLEEHIVKIDRIFENYPKAKVKEEFEKLLDNGNKLSLNNLQIEENIEDKVLIYSFDGIFMAIYKLDKRDNMLKIVKMFGR